MSAQSSDLRLHLAGYAFDPAEGEPDLPAALRLPPPPSGTAYYVVQFARPLTREERTHMQADHGLRLTDYVAHNGYIELLAPLRAKAVDKEPLVRARTAYHPAFKLSPALATGPRPAPEDAAPPSLELRALLFEGADAVVAASAITHAGGIGVTLQDDRARGGTASVRFTWPDASALPRLAVIGALRWIEPVTGFSKDSATAASIIQSGTVDQATIWERGLHGEEQVIGILDSGPIDVEHCFFADVADNNAGPAHRKILGARNAADVPPQPHATFVAGCAAGDDQSNPGASEARGGAWAARLVLGTMTDVQATSLLAELSLSAETGATIHSHSWHDNTQGTGQPALYNQTAADVDAFMWRNEDQLVLGSAGNRGEELGPPGTAKSALCVAASRTAPHEMELGDGNPGPTADGRLKPDLTAVGCSIHSATHGTACETDGFLGVPNACATSFAVPQAAAAAALVRQYFTEGWSRGGSPSALHARQPSGALLKAVLIHACRDMSYVPGYPSFDEGWGLIRLADVLDFADGPRRLQVWDRRHEEGLATGETFATHVQVEAGEPLRVTLAWSDAPALAGASVTTVNDLDLVVIAPDGGPTYLGNHFGGVWSAPGGDPETEADDTNPVERVLIEQPVAGEWRIEVRARAVHRGAPGQGFALVVTGALIDVELDLLRDHASLLHRLDHLLDQQSEPVAGLVRGFEALLRGFADLLDDRAARLGHVEPDLLQGYECLLLGAQNALRRLSGLPREPLPPECGGPSGEPGVEPEPELPEPPDPPEPVKLPDLVPLPPPLVILPGDGDDEEREDDSVPEGPHDPEPGEPISGAGGFCGDLAPWGGPSGGGLIAGNVRVMVRNIGQAPAPPSVTAVDFHEIGEVRFQPTPALAPGEEQLLVFTIPRSDNPRGDCYGAGQGTCRYRITANAGQSFAERDHENNVVTAACAVSEG